VARLDGINCIEYSRVSTEQQAGETQTSLADQDQACDALAAKLGTSIGARYADKGASGATVAKRPDLLRLIADCEASPRPASRPGLVLVLNDSRWGRFPDPEESAYWRTHLRRFGWLVRFAENDESQNLTVRSVMRAIVASQATQKREDVRANAKRGSRGTASLGYWATLEPYGYRRQVVYPAGRERTLARRQRKAIDEKVVLVPDPTEAAIVRECFLRYATGTDTLASLVEWLRLEVPVRKWTRAAVRYTLHNPAYIGDVVSGKTTAGAHERDAAPEGEWVVRKDAHPAIVSRTLFSAVQDLLARNKRWTNRVRTDWLVSGLVCCRCGQPYLASGGSNSTSGAITRAYTCGSKKGVASDRCQYRGAIKKEWLEGAVIATVASVVGSPTYRRRLAGHLDRILAEQRTEPAATTTQLEQEIVEGTRSRDRLVQAVADGTLLGDEAKDRLDAVRRLLARLEARRDALAQDRTSQRTLDAERDRMLALAVDFRTAVATLQGPALRELLRPWIARAVFDGSDRTLTIDIRHLPTFTHGDLSQMASLSSQTQSYPWHIDGDAAGVTRRTVVVGAPR
jgi:DNA invertase Pin-like site-specific DNA recombinase